MIMSSIVQPDLPIVVGWLRIEYVSPYGTSPSKHASQHSDVSPSDPLSS